ncbi:discoidin domain-containing protein [Streptomyces sp. NPDC017520]|uniref:discoidin domain-containing protein n=1 Tax=Streptomyces sp. NPDC017520 TaxID=3364998 RepID=UPI00378E0241
MPVGIPVAAVPRRRRPTSGRGWIAGVLPASVVGALLALAPAPAAQAAPSLLSRGKSVTDSRQEHHGTPAPQAVDGDYGTRWSSAASDAQWLQVDLGPNVHITAGAPPPR